VPYSIRHAILTSGPLSYPINGSVGAVYIHKGGKGKLAVLGSVEIFSDEYYDKEENSKLFDFLLKFFYK